MFFKLLLAASNLGRMPMVLDWKLEDGTLTATITRRMQVNGTSLQQDVPVATLRIFLKPLAQ